MNKFNNPLAFVWFYSWVFQRSLNVKNNYVPPQYLNDCLRFNSQDTYTC